MMRKKLPADQAAAARKSTAKRLWTGPVLAIVAAVVLGVTASDAQALALGRVTVQSALGEPLRADIDIPEINAEEIASLRAVIASPDAFRAAGLDFSPSIADVQISLQRRPDGRYFLRLTSSRPVSDPFIDLILEANWSSGRIVRDYTMLFDPPNLRQTPQTAIAAQVSPVPAPGDASARTTAPLASGTTPSTRSTVTPAGRTTARGPAKSATPAAGSASADSPVSGGGKQVTVQSGDTAGKIAAANKPATISLDQMLVALLSGNPTAFIGGNINRIKAGAVLDVPNAEQAAAIGAGDAKQTVIAQSRDFNEFRRRLAEGLPTAQVGTADRQASGKLQAQVEDKAPAVTTPDKLTLSKGALQGKAAEEKIARDRTARDAATRVAELNKNITDLNRLGTATNPAMSSAAPATPAAVVLPAPAATSAASAAKSVVTPASPPSVPVAGPAPAPAIAPVPTAAPVVTTTPALAVPVPAAAVLPPPVALVVPDAVPTGAASAPTEAAVTTPTPAVAPASAARPTPAIPAKAAAESSLVSDLLDNPLLPALGGGLLALLLGFGFYRARQRKKSTQVDSSFLESRLQPDSFFGASGGQRIDTAESSVAGSSMVYSPSQLDAAGDVDPVAEADVYLAYGRDLQAEEILKEALRTSPQRVAIYGKLLEIYSKRRDAKAFEQVASEAYSLTHGEGAEWEVMSRLGQELDPGNTLYRPGGHLSAVTAGAAATFTAAVTGPAALNNQDFGMATVPQMLTPTETYTPSSMPDLDLDLDFSLGDDVDTAPAQVSTTPDYQHQTTGAFSAGMPGMDVSNASSSFGVTTPMRLDAPGLTVSGNRLNGDSAPAAAPAPASSGMMEFDLDALSLDLPGSSAPASRTTGGSGFIDMDGPTLITAATPLAPVGFDGSNDDPLSVKLSLAEEFNAIGDPDGARSLAEEVLAEASGDLKNRAQRFLAEIA